MKRSVLRARCAVLRFAGPAGIAVVLLAGPASAQWIGQAGGDGTPPPAAKPTTMAPVAPSPAAPVASPAMSAAPASTGSFGAGGLDSGGFSPAPGGFSPAPGMGDMGAGMGAPGMGAPGGGGPNAAAAARCTADIGPLRKDLETRGAAVQAAAKKKRPPSELCPLFRRLSVAYDNFSGYLTKNKSTCGVPDDALKQIKKGSTQVAGTRDKVCEVAAAGGTGGPGGPAPVPQGMLSQGLNLPSGLPSVNSDRPGGVYDTLGGSALR